MSYPSEATLAARSAARSSKLMKTPASPKRVAPFTRKVIPKRVLPHPAAPHSNVGRPAGNPPNVTSSRPPIPVGVLASRGASNLPILTVAALVIRTPNRDGARALLSLPARDSRPVFRQGDVLFQQGLDEISQGAILLLCAVSRRRQKVRIEPKGYSAFHWGPRIGDWWARKLL